MTTLPPPPPPIWAPRFRAWVQRVFTWLDRRKARILVANGQNLADWQWRRAYQAWWYEHGWRDGAPTADEAYAAVMNERKAKRP